MKRLTLEELKAQKSAVVELDAIKGGNAENCHLEANAGFWDTVGHMIKENTRAFEAWCSSCLN
jgi:hypothetical protein